MCELEAVVLCKCALRVCVAVPIWGLGHVFISVHAVCSVFMYCTVHKQAVLVCHFLFPV